MRAIDSPRERQELRLAIEGLVILGEAPTPAIPHACHGDSCSKDEAVVDVATPRRTRIPFP